MKIEKICLHILSEKIFNLPHALNPKYLEG
jgi:hypothetical protein